MRSEGELFLCYSLREYRREMSDVEPKVTDG
jgi:hypothetical protein